MKRVWLGMLFTMTTGCFRDGFYYYEDGGEPLAVGPEQLALLVGQRWQISPTGGVPPYSYAATGGGSITDDGLFVAPSTAGPVVVRARDAADQTTEVEVSVVESFVASAAMCLSDVGSDEDAGLLSDSNNNHAGGGGYENLEDCQYVIRPQGGPPVTLFASSWNVEALCGGCDALEVHDGDSAAAPLLGTFSGDAPLSSITAPSGTMFLRWRTDANTKLPGFELRWRTEWETAVVLSATPPTVSPGGSTRLIATGGVGPYTFSLVSGDGVLTPDTAEPHTARLLAGASLQSITVRATDARGGQSDTTVDVLDYRTMCQDLSSSAGSGGLFDSGGADGPYGDFEDCEFLIDPPGTDSVTLFPNRFHTESENIAGLPLLDFLEVYDGTDATGTLLGVFEGNDLWLPVTAASGALFLRFASDYSITRSGFDLTWR